MKIPLIYFSLLSVSSAFSLLNFISPAHAITIQPIPHIGTWQNKDKDEDSDGLSDELDAYSYHRLA